MRKCARCLCNYRYEKMLVAWASFDSGYVEALMSTRGPSISVGKWMYILHMKTFAVSTAARSVLSCIGSGLETGRGLIPHLEFCRHSARWINWSETKCFADAYAVEIATRNMNKCMLEVLAVVETVTMSLGHIIHNRMLNDEDYSSNEPVIQVFTHI